MVFTREDIADPRGPRRDTSAQWGRRCITPVFRDDSIPGTGFDILSQDEEGGLRMPAVFTGERTQPTAYRTREHRNSTTGRKHTPR